MKKIAFLTLLAAFTFSCKESPKEEKLKLNNNKISLESKTNLTWQTSYKGLLPCASCPGISIDLDLDADNTFRKTIFYLEEEDSPTLEQGKYSFNKEKNIITLHFKKETEKYKIEENYLSMLNSEDEEAKGELADKYRLIKMSDATIDFPNKVIKGFLTIGHEVSVFSPCGSSKSFWINERDSDLTTIYRKTVGEQAKAYTPIMAELVLKNKGKATEGFPENYDSVLEVLEVKSVEYITPDNYCTF